MRSGAGRWRRHYWLHGAGRYFSPRTTRRLLPPGRELLDACPRPPTGRRRLGAYSEPLTVAACSRPPPTAAADDWANTPKLSMWPPTVGRLLLAVCHWPRTAGRLPLALTPRHSAGPPSAECHGFVRRKHAYKIGRWQAQRVPMHRWPSRERSHSGRGRRANETPPWRASWMALAAEGDQRIACTSRARARAASNLDAQVGRKHRLPTKRIRKATPAITTLHTTSLDTTRSRMAHQPPRLDDNRRREPPSPNVAKA